MSRSAPLVLVAFLASACGGSYAQRGEALYHEGRYIEAAEVFEYTEARLPGSQSDVCACYGLYRGLNFLRLGDLRSARHWLAYAYSVERETPGTLSDDERTRLDQGWRELEQRAGGAPAPAAGEAQALAAPGGEPTPRVVGAVPNGKRSVHE